MTDQLPANVQNAPQVPVIWPGKIVDFYSVLRSRLPSEQFINGNAENIRKSG